MFTYFALCLHNRADLLADFLGIPFVYDVKERREVAVILTVRIHSVIDSYEPLTAGTN